MALDVERLINCVRSHSFLYDLGHQDYKNTSRKAFVWEQIAEDLNENTETVKLKWKTVRDGYIKFRKQLKEGSNKKVINYIWSSQLKFLDDYQVSRKSKTPNVSLVSELQLSEDEWDIPSQSYSPTSVPTPPPAPPGPLRDTPARRKRREQQHRLKYLKSKRLKKENDNQDATDHLFLSYSETFKTFSPRQQALLKVELAKLFSNAELNALQMQETESLQESLVAGSSPGYGAARDDVDSALGTTDVHTVEDDDSDDDVIEFVNPTEKEPNLSHDDSDLIDPTG